MEDQPCPGEPPGGLERQEITDTLERLRDRPPPSDPRSGGCVTAIVAVIALVLMPFIGRGFDPSGGAMLGIGIVLGLVALIGAYFGIFGSGIVGGAIIADVEEAIEELMVEWPDGDPAVMREAVIRILGQSTISTGPTTIAAIDVEEVGIRLLPTLDYVLDIERFLLERQEIYPVFTTLYEESD
jgi:hypothetical protein